MGHSAGELISARVSIWGETVADDRKLTLEFKVESDDALTSSEFLSLFECIDRFGRAVAENEAKRFIESLGLPSGYRTHLTKSIIDIGKQQPAPVEIESAERGSWDVRASLTGLAILWGAKEFIASPIGEAWNGSIAREHMVTFFRDQIFGGATRLIESLAAKRSKFGNLKITRVDEMSSGPNESHVLIRLKRSEIIEVEQSDQELIEEFLKRLQGQ